MQRIKAKWNSDESEKLNDLGMTDQAKEHHYWRELYIDITKINLMMQSDEGLTDIGFSMISGDSMVIDMPFNKVIEVNFDIIRAIEEFYK